MDSVRRTQSFGALKLSAYIVTFDEELHNIYVSLNYIGMVK
jgi:hypothetical protein